MTGRPRVGPPNTALAGYLALGLTHQEIADAWFSETGNRVQRSSISAAVHRAGLATETPRYDDVIPWTGLRPADCNSYPIRMLRNLGRRRRGLPFTDPEEEKRLDTWLNNLRESGELITYSPFSGVFRVPGPWPDDGIPIVV